MKKKLYCRLILLACLLSGYSESALACKVPVFKYALDNWVPEPYPATVFHGGPLSPDEQALVNSLKSKTGSTANMRILMTDVSNETESAKNPVWVTQKNQKLPFLSVDYYEGFKVRSGNSGLQFLGSGPLETDTVKRMFDSPLKQELVHRLLNGDSIVWLFLQGENAQENAEAASLLQNQLKELKNTIKLEEDDKPGSKSSAEAPVPTTSEPIKIAFTLLNVSRKDPKEGVFVSQLLNLRKGLAETKGPIAIPVFGRGRVMDVLVGKEITQAKIVDLTTFLCGECSCTAKSQSEGIDLPLTALWPISKNGKYGEGKAGEETEPGLPSIGQLTAPPPAYLQVKSADQKQPVQGQPQVNRLKRNLAIFIITSIAGVGCVSFFIRRKGPR